MGTAPDPATWGMCRTCGAAVAPGREHCELCGADRPVAAKDVAAAPRGVRRRWTLTRLARAAAVIGVVVALGAALIPPALSGPPSVQDPLTTAAAYRLGPGNATTLEGEITGGDYVLGNYSTIDPYGASVTIAVFNATGWTAFVHHEPATPAWSLPSQPSGRIVFTATYTDTFVFVLTNPYPTSSGVNVTVYLTTQYESNVGNDGFG
jgi:hypothetical protein